MIPTTNNNASSLPMWIQLKQSNTTNKSNSPANRNNYIKGATATLNHLLPVLSDRSKLQTMNKKPDQIKSNFKLVNKQSTIELSNNKINEQQFFIPQDDPNLHSEQLTNKRLNRP